MCAAIASLPTARSTSERAGVSARFQKLERRLRTFFGETDGFLDFPLHIGLDRPELVAEAGGVELDPRSRQGIALLSFFELGRRAVFPRVAHRVAAKAVG